MEPPLPQPLYLPTSGTKDLLQGGFENHRAPQVEGPFYLSLCALNLPGQLGLLINPGDPGRQVLVR